MHTACLAKDIDKNGLATRPAEQGVAKPLRCERCQIGGVFLSVLGNNEFQNEAKHLRCLETLYRRRQTGGTQCSVPVVAAEIAELREVILFQAFIRIIPKTFSPVESITRCAISPRVDVLKLTLTDFARLLTQL